MKLYKSKKQLYTELSINSRTLDRMIRDKEVIEIEAPRKGTNYAIMSDIQKEVITNLTK